ncbi:hypothetical protein CSB11_00365 [Candidatus Campbellbacteria bacterium]|nr:MAG: hypothetical protein CSB11_00365 [Candidatus Campbellbacteria bacterium]
MIVREYKKEDYEQIKKIYLHPNTFGGQFDEARDTEEKISTLVNEKKNSVLVLESKGDVVGTVTIFEDGRSCWLYRFAVLPEYEKEEYVKLLYQKAEEVCKEMGHSQILVYAPAGEEKFEERYVKFLELNKGNPYTAFWKDIK